MDRPVSLATIVREWTRLGCLGFGGPPAHITLLRRLCVDDRAWLSPSDFEDAIAVTNMLPGRPRHRWRSGAHGVSAVASERWSAVCASSRRD